MRHLTATLIALAAAWCLSPGAAGARDFRFEDYFAGRTHATGQFSAINGVKRSFTVKLTGRWANRVLTLREDFVYDDGERDTKTWRFSKIQPGRYLGTREDVIGKTKVVISGDTARFTYLVDLDPGPKRNVVRFHDTMVLTSDGKVVNTAWVTKYGFPVARTKVNFKR